MSIAKEFLEKVSKYITEAEDKENDGGDDAIKCPECGADKVEVDGNEATCEECGKKWKIEDEEDDEEKE
jgi:DNA-directed RNA polymerase subunit RPC12/RpoP